MNLPQPAKTSTTPCSFQSSITVYPLGANRSPPSLNRQQASRPCDLYHSLSRTIWARDLHSPKGLAHYTRQCLVKRVCKSILSQANGLGNLCPDTLVPVAVSRSGEARSLSSPAAVALLYLNNSTFLQPHLYDPWSWHASHFVKDRE